MDQEQTGDALERDDERNDTHLDGTYVYSPPESQWVGMHAGTAFSAHSNPAYSHASLSAHGSPAFSHGSFSMHGSLTGTPSPVLLPPIL